MGRTAKIIVLIALLAVALCPILGHFFVLPVAAPVLAPVLPRPPHVPADASASYEWKASGLHWRWRRASPHGLVTWTATADDASVILRLGRNWISYTSFEDIIVFDTHEVAVPRSSTRDAAEPCRFSVPASNIVQFRQLIIETLAQPHTGGEAAVLHRISHLLSDARGHDLLTYSNGLGCVDLMAEDFRRPRTKTDPLKQVG